MGDTIAEDQQIADMMTDKATVEMESPVAGKVIELAGKVGDQIPIGSVLAVIETEGADRPAEPVHDSTSERPLGDGAVEPTPEQAEELPITAVDESEPEPAPAPAPKVEPEVAKKEVGGAHVLASPAVRARARDLGIGQNDVGRQGAANTGSGAPYNIAMAGLMAFDQLQAMGTALQREIRAPRERHDLGLPLVHFYPQPAPGMLHTIFRPIKPLAHLQNSPSMA